MKRSCEAPSDVFAASFLNATVTGSGSVILRDQFSERWDIAGVHEWATVEAAYAAVAAERASSVKTEPVRGTGELNDEEFLRLYLNAKPWPEQSRHAGKWCVVDRVGDPWAVRDVGVWESQQAANAAAMAERDRRIKHRFDAPPEPPKPLKPFRFWHVVFVAMVLGAFLWGCVSALT